MKTTTPTREIGKIASDKLEAALRPLREAAQLDRCFDGGEFSAPAWHENLEAETARCFADLAGEHGMTAEQIEAAFNLYRYGHA